MCHFANHWSSCLLVSFFDAGLPSSLFVWVLPWPLANPIAGEVALMLIEQSDCAHLGVISRTCKHQRRTGGDPAIGTMHGCCWDTCAIFACCGLAGKSKVENVGSLATSTKHGQCTGLRCCNGWTTSHPNRYSYIRSADHMVCDACKREVVTSPIRRLLSYPVRLVNHSNSLECYVRVCNKHHVAVSRKQCGAVPYRVSAVSRPGLI